MSSLSRLVAALVLIVGIVSGAAEAGEPLQPDSAFKMTVRQDGERILLGWDIAPGYYLYRDHFAVSADGASVPFDTPSGVAKDDPTFGNVEIYEHAASLSLVPPTGGALLDVTYQGCQDGGICYRPERRLIDTVTLAVTVPPKGPPLLSGFSSPAAKPSPVDVGPAFVVGEATSPVDELMARGGVALVLGGFFVFGLLLAFTPCVFPMYPIVAGLLARQGDRLTAGRGALLAATYVGGLALAFAAVGAFAGWSGANLQVVLQSTWTTAAIAAIFVALAASMFGAFELQLPSAWTTRIASRPAGERGTIGGAGIAGFTSALIVGPCVTAPLAGALLYIARSGDWALGAAALAALAIGKGAPLIAIAAAGGGFLPKAGAWMVSVKALFGFMFLGTALWIASPLLPGRLDQAGWALLLIAFAARLAFKPAVGGRRLAARAGAGAAGLAAIAVAVVALVSPAPAARLDFAPVADAASLSDELAGDRPALVYVTADWCVTCRTIDRSVLGDETVQGALSGLALIKVDVTDADASTSALMAELNVAGPPSMVFFDRKAKEVDGTRLVGDVSATALTLSAAKAGEVSR